MTIATISPQELHQRRTAGEAVTILDVRSPAEFEAVHATGAKNYPLGQLNPPHILQSLSISDNNPLYFICKMGGRSRKACEAFAASGFSNVVNVVGGTDRWVADGLPSVHGNRKTMALDRQVRIASGSLVLLGCLLGWLVQPAFYALSALIGAGLVFSGVTDTCGMGTVLAKMPWNQAAKPKTGAPAEAACETG